MPDKRIYMSLQKPTSPLATQRQLDNDPKEADGVVVSHKESRRFRSVIPSLLFLLPFVAKI